MLTESALIACCSSCGMANRSMETDRPSVSLIVAIRMSVILFPLTVTVTAMSPYRKPMSDPVAVLVAGAAVVGGDVVGVAAPVGAPVGDVVAEPDDPDDPEDPDEPENPDELEPLPDGWPEAEGIVKWALCSGNARTPAIPATVPAATRGARRTQETFFSSFSDI